jgi:hypothetical protein
MAEEEVDYSTVNWEEVEGELEALEMIFPEEYKCTAEKPYKFDLIINSNSDADQNHLKMKLIVEIPHNYPEEEIPFLRVKSLTPEYLNNTHLDQYETEIRNIAREALGGPCLFDIAEHLREQICTINDKVLDVYNGIMEQKAEEAKQEVAGMTFASADHLDYTPVNKETFGAWCKVFLEELKIKDA